MATAGTTIAATVVAAAAPAIPTLAVAAGPTRAVIVQTHGRAADVAAAVRRSGGTVSVHLPIVDGFAARVPAAALPRLARHPGVRAITPNAPVRVAAVTADDEEPINPQSVNSVYVRETGADRLNGAGYTGGGSPLPVRIALVDTGVTEVPDLAGRIARVPDPTDGVGEVACVNFSGTPTCDDEYGHGTFLAGLAVGSGAASGGRFRGVAPGAQIVSIKIAGRDGSADVTKLLAAIQWVVFFARDLNIRVLNLSLGTDSRVSYRYDPLNFAVERAWRSGVAVVVSASNRGPDAGTISKPADDPLVLTVGAVDDHETPAIDDDRLPNFTGRGPTVTDGLAKPDVVAPGARVVSLRAPGSMVEERVPGGLLAGTPYRRGSGTSMSAAITSGLAALVLERHPHWQPDRLKFAFMATARKVASRDPYGVGKGLVDAWAAAFAAPAGLANQDVRVLSDGTGTLDGSRGSMLVTGRQCGLVDPLLDPQCAVVHGEQTAQGMRFDRREYTEPWDGSSWYDSQWYGSSWYGSSWYGDDWARGNYRGSSWYGDVDEIIDYGVVVQGSSWYGAWG